MTRHYYAYSNAYGIGTIDENGERIGSVMVFASRADRDAWVADETDNSNMYNEAISSKSARHELLKEWGVDHSTYLDGIPTMSDLVAYHNKHSYIW